MKKTFAIHPNGKKMKCKIVDVNGDVALLFFKSSFFVATKEEGKTWKITNLLLSLPKDIPVKFL